MQTKARAHWTTFALGTKPCSPTDRNISSELNLQEKPMFDKLSNKLFLWLLVIPTDQMTSVVHRDPRCFSLSFSGDILVVHWSWPHS